MAEAVRGNCSVCGNEGAVTAAGGLRHHFTEDPEKQAGPDSRKCRGVGLPPAGAVSLPETGTGYVCRIPPGPEGCGRPVMLTSNGRARSHLGNRNTPCPGGSDWPLAVDAAGNRTDTAPVGGDDPQVHQSDLLDRFEAAPATHIGRPAFHSSTAYAPALAAAVSDPGTVLDRLDTDPRDATVTRTVETIGAPPYCERCNTDMHRCPGCGTDVPHGTVACKECADVECACNLQWTSNRAMRVAGHDDMDCDGAPMVPPASQDAAEADDLVFDVTHRLTDSTGTEWVHPGTAADCRLPDCCTHPGGFVYADDDNGHNGSFCRDCGAEEPGLCMHPYGFTVSGPDGDDLTEEAARSTARICVGCGAEEEWKTPVHLLTDMPLDVQALAADNPECWDCGHEVTPRAVRFGPDGGVMKVAWECSRGFRSCHPDRLFEEGVCRPQPSTESRLDDLPEGAHFTRRKMPGTVYRAVSCTASAVEAVVVSAGPYKGRLGTLTNLEEEITWTDEHGTPQVRRGHPQAPASGSILPDSPGRSPQQRTPSAPGRPQSSKSPAPAPGSTPPTPVSARDAGTPSTPETASGPTERAATSARTAGRRTALPDAFSTPKAAMNESDKYDRFGRYKLTHPDTGKPVKWTRATTFAKSVQDTFALSMWSQRMTLKGAAMRQDITAAVLTLDVKADKDRVNALVEDAKKAAGDKVAANKGTAVHAFTEDRDKLLAGEDVDVRPVPEEFVPTVEAYEETLRAFGLEPVPGLIEFTTAVKQYEVAGTSDRVYRVTRDITVQLNKRTVTLYAGEYVIGDVKGLALTERIPTPTGWTTMGEVRVGDTVFDAYGQPTRVTVKSRTKRIGTYIVRFDDGSSVTCDTEHIWWTSTGTRPGEPTAKSIQEILATLQDPRTGQKHHRVPVAGPLELPEADLPIDPYLLGCWLGDGHRRGGTITKGADLFEILETDGHLLGPEQAGAGNCTTRTVQGLTTALRAAGLLGNKHIPAVYLRASTAQRTALLRGLMDTDGTWNRARCAATFSTVDKALALQVEELLLSLGQRPSLATVQGHGFGKEVTSYPVSFTPVDLQPFRLPRKADQAAASTKPVTRSTRRVIVSVEPGPDVETACIGVDAPTHTYLAGDRMIPTHNTGADLSYGWQEIAIQLALYAQGINTSGVWDWGTGKWGKPVLPDNPDVLLKVRTDVGLVPHLPVDRTTTGAPLATLYAVDLDAGWSAAVLCASVRTWRKERTLATPLEIADVAEVDPDTGVPSSTLAEAAQRPVSRPAVVSRPVTLEDKARAVTSRAEASVVWKEATAARVTKAELERLTGIMQRKLESFVEQGS